MSDIITLKFSVTGITCEACLKLIKRRVEKVEGFLDLNISLSGDATIIANRPVELDEITKALEGTEYQIVN